MATKTLLERISFQSTLENAWRSVRRNSHRKSSGPDGMTCDAFSRNARHELNRIQKELRDGTYKFTGFIGKANKKRDDANPKDPNDWRPISIASIRDRVVHRAILERIWPFIRDHVHTQASYGGIRRYHVRRKRSSDVPSEDVGPRSVRAAAQRILELREQGYTWVFETDIESFFIHIDKNRLLAQLDRLLPDETINHLLQDAVDTTIVNSHRFTTALRELWTRAHGVPQGGVLSSTLANLYLYDLDDALSKADLKPVRYLDDLVVLAKNRSDLDRAYDICKNLLPDLNLTIHPPDKEINGRVKTAFHDPGESFDFLGLTFNQHSIRPRDKQREEFHQQIDELTDWRRTASLVKVIDDLDRYTRSWISAYDFCNISKKELKAIDERIAWRIKKWMTHKEIIRNPRQLSNEAYSALGVTRIQNAHIEPIVRPRASAQAG